jgi:hypothetical protein
LKNRVPRVAIGEVWRLVRLLFSAPHQIYLAIPPDF